MQRPLIVAVMFACLIASPSLARHRTIVDANGNSAGNVVSHKTGATARVGAQYASRFQSYIDDLESRGASVRFMGGIRRGHCWSGGLHPCGRALDVCQLARGRVDHRCNLPSRHELGQIAAAHGLYEGGRWQNSDYGHAQVGCTAGCGDELRTTIVASARSRRTHVAVASFTPPDRLAIH